MLEPGGNEHSLHNTRQLLTITSEHLSVSRGSSILLKDNDLCCTAPLRPDKKEYSISYRYVYCSNSTSDQRHVQTMISVHHGSLSVLPCKTLNVCSDQFTGKVLLRDNLRIINIGVRQHASLQSHTQLQLA